MTNKSVGAYRKIGSVGRSFFLSICSERQEKDLLPTLVGFYKVKFSMNLDLWKSSRM